MPFNRDRRDVARTRAATLREARQRRELTQAQVGRLLDPPIDPSLVSRYESGLRVPPTTLAQLARILKLELSVHVPDVVHQQVAS
jgi:transcriptional regulator with XRE-family HTH domain